MIDEIDLHLHPKWQRRVVGDLKKTFPEIQFIVTSHSPSIVQSLRDGELINLDPGTHGEYENRSIEDILEGLMGVDMPQRSSRMQELQQAAKAYLECLDQLDEGASNADAEELARKLDALEAAAPDVVATGNPGCLMQLRAGVRRRGLRLRVEHPITLLDAAYV